MSNKPRKTVEIDYILDTGNYFLKNSPDTLRHREQRIATANFMETILLHANAYAGFNYLDSAKVDHKAAKFDAYDDSRRVYFTKS